MKIVTLILVVLFCLSGCSSQKPETVIVGNGAQAAVETHDTQGKFIPDNRDTAKFLDGKDFDTALFPGQKILYGFFSYRHKDALPMLKALVKIKEFEAAYQFRVFAVSINFDEKEAVKKFLSDNGITVPVILENSGLELATKHDIENEVAVLGLTNKHSAAFGIKKYIFADMKDGEDFFLDYLKENLSIKKYHSTEPRLGLHPKAPDFMATTLDGKKISLSQWRGKAVHLIFFSPKCSHCQHEMFFLRDKLYSEFKDKGYVILAVSALKLEGETLDLYKSFKFLWPVIDDSDRKIRKLYSNEQGVPENFFIDKEGSIRFHLQGFSEMKQDAYRMQILSLLGLPNPPLLSDKHFNGADSCMICHEAQYASWSVTPHAHAWETLEIKGEDTNPQCIGCHSLGMNDPRGYKVFTDPETKKQVASVPPPFQNVQCEHCHGIGGPHKTMEEITPEILKQKCLECHTPTFSLYFDYEERLKKVDHSNADMILKMSEEERMNLLKKVSKKPEDLFDTKIKYVGNDTCLSCHATEHKNWSGSVHAKAFDTLKKAGHETDVNCLACHTVGYGESSGYQENLKKDLQGVGCESCHGPGEKHVATKKKQDIRGLGDDCPFCVVEQICLSCHDMKNSPDFNIHTGLEKIKGHH